MGTTPEHLGFIENIDWTEPDEITSDGLRIFSVRCRVPLPPLVQRTALAGVIENSDLAVDLSVEAQEAGLEWPRPAQRDLTDIGHNGDGGDRVIIDDGDGVVLEPDQTGDPGSDDEITLGQPRLVSGIASSTSIDFFGTEMSLRALKLMAVQMMRTNGIPYLPRHNNGLAGAVEWDSVIGRTVHAEIVPVEDVAKAYNASEAQFILRTTIALYDDEPAAQALLRRIARGEAIGQSIGGWFTSLQILQNEDGDVERVIVQGVELDHLAVTRAPANPDSLGIVNLRDRLSNSAAMHRANTLLPRVMDGQVVCTTPLIARAVQAQAMQERHLLSVVDNGDGTASITLEIHDHEDEYEDMGAGKKKRDLSAAQAAPETPAPADALDTSISTGDDAGDDARRSALDPITLTPADVAGAQEQQMPEQDSTTGVTLDAIRSALADALQPVSTRLDALEAKADERATPTNPEPAPAAEPTVDDRVLTAERSAGHGPRQRRRGCTGDRQQAPDASWPQHGPQSWRWPRGPHRIRGSYSGMPQCVPDAGCCC